MNFNFKHSFTRTTNYIFVLTSIPCHLDRRFARLTVVQVLRGAVAVLGHRADITAAAVGGADAAAVAVIAVDGGVVDHVDDGHREVDAHGVHVGEPQEPEEHDLHMIRYYSLEVSRNEIPRH